MTTATQTVPGPLTFPGASEALRALEPTLRALPRAEVRPFRAAIPQAVTNALQVAGALAEDRELLAAAFRPQGFDPEDYAELERLAQALWQADVDLRLQQDPRHELSETLDAAGQLRGQLLDAARYLWRRDPELAPKVVAIGSGRGHLDTADDLLTLSSLFAERWGWAASRSRVEAVDLTRARALATRIAAALRPAPGEAEIAAARDLRDRAGTLLRRWVDTIRTAAAFVHRERPEAMERYPSLFRGRTRPRRRPAPEATTDAESEPS